MGVESNLCPSTCKQSALPLGQTASLSYREQSLQGFWLPVTTAVSANRNVTNDIWLATSEGLPHVLDRHSRTPLNNKSTRIVWNLPRVRAQSHATKRH